MSGRYFEDFAVGERMATGSVTVSAEMIRTFAQDYDPQVFHLDAHDARDSFFGELVASGWHTASMVMRLMVDARILDGTPLVGAGVDELRWPAPTRPGDRVTATVEVLELRPSRSRPDRGIMRTRVEAVNQDGAVVQSMVAAIVLPRRADVAAE